MGGTAQDKSKSKTTSRSSSSTHESALSQEQLAILQRREQQYNDYFFPELISALESTDINSPVGAANMAQQGNAINKSFGASENMINQNLAQQGLSGDASGVQAALKASNARTRSSALADAYYNSLLSGQNQKANLLQLGLGMSPTPTSSAQYHQTSETASDSKTKSSGFQWNLSG